MGLISTAELASAGVPTWRDGPTVVSQEALWKSAVQACSLGLGNVTLSPAPATIDAVTLVSGNRYGIIDQTTGSENGIYTFDGADLVRADDYTTSANVAAGVKFYAQEGTANTTKTVRMITTGTILVGTTVTVWEEDGGGSGGGGTVYTSTTDQTDTPIVAALESMNICRLTAGGGALTSTLPAISTGDIGKRVQFTFKIIGFAVPGDTLVISPDAGDTIDAGASATISFPGGVIFYVDAATSWRIEAGLAA